MATNRRRGREYALKVLFALKHAGEQVDPDHTLEQFWSNFTFSEDPLGEPQESGASCVPQAVKLFTADLVRGVINNRGLVDEQIGAAAQHWSLSRMAAVDLAVLRIATYELMFGPKTPAAVILNEAIEIAKRYGTKESPAYVNGLLDKIAQQVAGSDRKSDSYLKNGDTAC